MASTRSSSAADAGHSRLETLDGLRFVAALAVLLYHYAFRAWNMDAAGVIQYPVLGPISQYGYLGVDLFFMISGFVILMSASKGGAGAFVLSRVVRLYPVYWFCAAATFVFLSFWTAAGEGWPTIGDLLMNLTMLQSLFGIGHLDGSYWSLIVELHFYLIIVIVLWVGQLHRIDTVLALWLALGILNDFVPAHMQFGDLYAAAWCHYFVAGALAYRMRTAGFSRWRLLLYGVAFAQAARHAHWYMALKERLTHIPHDPLVVQAVVAAFFAFFLLFAGGRLNLRGEGLRTVGALTYPLYLIHGAIGSALLVAWVRSSRVSPWLALAVATVLAIAAAWAIHRFVERPVAPRLRTLLKPWLIRQPAQT